MSDTSVHTWRCALHFSSMWVSAMALCSTSGYDSSRNMCMAMNWCWLPRCLLWDLQRVCGLQVRQQHMRDGEELVTAGAMSLL